MFSNNNPPLLLFTHRPSIPSRLPKRYRDVQQRGSRMVQIVMEYADGGDMYDMIQRHKATRRPFSEAQIRTWFVQMSMALAYVHEQGMVLPR